MIINCGLKIGCDIWLLEAFRIHVIFARCKLIDASVHVFYAFSYVLDSREGHPASINHVYMEGEGDGINQMYNVNITM